jgi:hypothetical protein
LAPRIIDIVLDREGVAPQKIHCQSGYNVLLTPAAGGAAPLSEAVPSLLFPQSAGRRPAPAAEGSLRRCGLTLVDGPALFRYALDCRSGTISLGRKKEEETAFAELSTDAAVIEKVSRHTLRFPALDCYRELFLFVLGPPRAGAVSEEFFGGLKSAAAAGDAERLQKLEGELTKLEQVTQLERIQVEQQAQLFKVEERRLRYRDLARQLQKAKEGYAPYAAWDTVKDLPADIEAAAGAYGIALEKLTDERRELDRRAEQLMSEALSAVARPLLRQPVFLAALGGIVLSFVLGTSYPALRLPGLGGGFLALIGAAYLAIQHFINRDKTGIYQEALRTLEEEKKALGQKLEQETLPLRTLMQKFSLTQPPDLIDIHRERRAALAQIQEEAAALEKFKSENDPAALDREHGALTQELGQLERQLADLSLSGMTQDGVGLRREVAGLRDRLDGGTGAAGQWGGLSPYDRLIAAAAAALGLPREPVAKGLANGLNINLAWLSNRFLTQALFRDGLLVEVMRGDSRRAPVGQLNEAEAFLLYFALRLTLLQGLSARLALPVVVEADRLGFKQLDVALIAKALAHLGKSMQIIHPTSDSRFKDSAQHVAVL